MNPLQHNLLNERFKRYTAGLRLQCRHFLVGNIHGQVHGFYLMVTISRATLRERY
jgi:hypothetical protein